MESENFYLFFSKNKKVLLLKMTEDKNKNYVRIPSDNDIFFNKDEFNEIIKKYDSRKIVIYDRVSRKDSVDYVDGKRQIVEKKKHLMCYAMLLYNIEFDEIVDFFLDNGLDIEFNDLDTLIHSDLDFSKTTYIYIDNLTKKLNYEA